jgi:acyl carrier protein
MRTTAQKVGKKIADETGVGGLELDEYDLPINELGVDSLILELILLWIDEEFGVSIPRNDINEGNLGTPNLISEYIEQKMRAKNEKSSQE